MKRYRLRFLLQEIDLARAATLIGRSPDCDVTIEDPLVSRQHARIAVDEDGATVEDLGSRNGVKVNGRAIKGKARLEDGDRLRIGTQELVFCEVREGRSHAAKTTGFLSHCARCHLPYPQELAACPSCGATEQIDDDTMTGELAAASQHSWSLQLLVEVLEKAVSMNRTPDVVRTLQRMAAQIDERLGSGGALDPKQLASVAGAAFRASAAAADPGWAAWVLRVYERLRAVPPEAAIEGLATLAMTHRGTLRPAVAAVVSVAGAPGAPPCDARDLARLERLLAAMDMAEPPGAETTGTNPAIR